MFGRIDPGDGIHKNEIYEVWGDMLEFAADQSVAVIDSVRHYLETSALAEYFNCQQLQARSDGHPFLALQWDDFVAHIDSRAFGEHLDVYLILALKRGLLDHPDPSLRIAGLEGWQRRNLQIFQTLLKRAIEEALDAVDEGRLR